MPHIKCTEPSCEAYITDPCVKLEGLFLIRADLSEKLGKNPTEPGLQQKLDQLDELLDSQLGVTQEKMASLSVSKSRALKKTDEMLFILTCINGHKRQYSITCES